MKTRIRKTYDRIHSQCGGPSILNDNRLVSGSVNEDDLNVDSSLRPRSLSAYVGQNSIKRNLGIAITAAKQRGEPLDHVLLYGPPGLGKTTLANIIASEMGVRI